MMMAIDGVDVSYQGITKVIRIYPEGNMDVQGKCDVNTKKTKNKWRPHEDSEWKTSPGTKVLDFNVHHE